LPNQQGGFFYRGDAPTAQARHKVAEERTMLSFKSREQALELKRLISGSDLSFKNEALEQIDYDMQHYWRKGKFGGSCNRAECQESNALWFNHSTQAYYCEHCARQLNDLHRENAAELYNGPLCLKVFMETPSTPIKRK
jgi:hypothetical protein